MTEELRMRLKKWGWILFVPLIFTLVLAVSRINAPLCDGGVRVGAWIDTNADGTREEDEPPLAGVCAGYSHSSRNIESYNSNVSCNQNYEITDKDGSWGEFMPGSCGEELFVYAFAPSGYQPTTDVAIDGYSGDFGFIQKNVKVTRDFLTMDEFARIQSRKILFQEAKTLLTWLFVIVSTIGGMIWLDKKGHM